MRKSAFNNLLNDMSSSMIEDDVNCFVEDGILNISSRYLSKYMQSMYGKGKFTKITPKDFKNVKYNDNPLVLNRRTSDKYGKYYIFQVSIEQLNQLTDNDEISSVNKEFDLKQYITLHQPMMIMTIMILMKKTLTFMNC